MSAYVESFFAISSKSHGEVLLGQKLIGVNIVWSLCSSGIIQPLVIALKEQAIE